MEVGSETRGKVEEFKQGLKRPNRAQRGLKHSYLFTSECVTPGHPDKICDIISDSILDACLAQDPGSRVACECFATTDFLLIGGEITTKAKVDYVQVAKDAIAKIGYTHPNQGFNTDCEVLCKVHTQSPDIALGTDDSVGGAGDQGMMFGGACSETTDFMPLAVTLSRELTNRLTELVRLPDSLFYPDGKAQVTVAYGRDNNPLYVDTVVVSIMHDESLSIDKLRKFVRYDVIAPVLRKYNFEMKDVQNVFINPTGKFVVGGPHGDTGLTGRKIIVDTYGGAFSHGGGAFSGKDPTKVDRSGAYMARYIAKNLVKSGVVSKVEVQLAYAIGIAKPVSVNIKAFSTNTFPISLISKAVYNLFDMTPQGIIRTLSLNTPFWNYSDLASFGHFGETSGVDKAWERTDKADEILAFCESNYSMGQVQRALNDAVLVTVQGE